MNNALPPRVKSIRSRLMLLVAALAIASGLVVFVITMARDLDTRYERMRANSVAQAQTLAELSVFAVYTRNRAELDRILNAAALRRETRYLVLLDTADRVVASQLYHGPDTLGGLPKPEAGKPVLASVLHAPGFWDIIRGEDLIVISPIRAAGQIDFAPPGRPPEPPDAVGCLILGISTNDLRARAVDDFVASIAGVILLMLFAGFAAAALTRRLAAPIGEIANMADRLADGELGISVAPSDYSEIQRLNSAFNRMSSRLLAAQEELLSYNRTLEQKVATRTLELQAAAKHAHQLAQHDSVTGLANRTLLGTRLHFAIAAAERRRDRVAIVVVDTSGPGKAENKPDEPARGSGLDDNVDLLRAIAARIASVSRVNDTVARTGSAEFTIVIPDMALADAETAIADRMRQLYEALAAPVTIGALPMHLALRIGVSVFPEDGTEPRLLLAQARAAARPASAREPCGYHSRDVASRIQRRARIEEQIGNAIERREIHSTLAIARFISTGIPSRAQLNLAWRHPELGDLHPEEFMPLASHAGLNEPMLRLALDESAAFSRGSIGHGLPIGVRLTVSQFEDLTTVRVLTAHLRDRPTGLPPPELIIPEAAIGADIGGAIIVLRELKALGVTLVLENFGAGFASLPDLARLPIDAAALDPSIVAGLQRNASDRALIEGYVHMAHSLDIRVIATGISTRGELEQLVEYGCDEGMGPLWK